MDMSNSFSAQLMFQREDNRASGSRARFNRVKLLMPHIVERAIACERAKTNIEFLKKFKKSIINH
jgi:hypothetical protein